MIYIVKCTHSKFHSNQMILALYHYSSSNPSSLFFHSYILHIFYEFGITYSYAPLSHSIYFMHAQNVITLSLSLFFLLLFLVDF